MRSVPRFAGKARLLLVGWVLLLALLPWWLGLPLLLAAGVVLPLLRQRLLPAQCEQWRLALRWGLGGWLLALLLALGASVLAWIGVLLGALAGGTLLVGLDAWLDRGRPPAGEAALTAEWPQLALAPVGPAALIVELTPPLWQGFPDAGVNAPVLTANWQGDGYCLADGTQILGADRRACVSRDSRWFVAGIKAHSGILLWDGDRRQLHRLRGWQLSGWYGNEPWCARGDSDMPLPLSMVLGNSAR